VNGKVATTKSVKLVPLFDRLMRSQDRILYHGVGYYSENEPVPDGILNLYRGVHVAPSADMKWLANVIDTGIFVSKTFGEVEWSSAILKAAVLASFRETVVTKPVVTTQELGRFLAKHIRIRTTRRKIAGSGRKREPHWYLPELDETRRIFMTANPALRRKRE